jgi:hypothetical protein
MCGVQRRQPTKLAARVDTRLDEDLPQLRLDGAVTDEQLRADLRVRQAIASQSRDLCFWCGQV